MSTVHLALIRRFRVSAAPLALAVALLALVPRVGVAGGAATRAVATENADSSRAALAVLGAGGNAIDAAVTAAFVAGVASPTSSGIGGGGFALVWLGAEHRPFLLDFRETAPAGLDPAAQETLPPEQAGHSIGVPGEVAGLFELHRRFGKLAWADVVAPAANIARDGYRVSEHVARQLKYSGDRLKQVPELAALFFGKPAARLGTRVRNPKLAATLARIGSEGPKALYAGSIAEDIVRAARAAGSAMTLEDLARYEPVERIPLALKWEGHDIYTMPPPSAGGLLLAQTLGLYTKEELSKLGHNTGAYQHLLAEAARGALADRVRFVGDPDHEQVPLARLTSADHLAARRKMIGLDRTHWIKRFGPEEHGTHHLVTADQEGNVVSLTTTVNRLFGAKVVAPASGVVLNDELGDFTPRAIARAFGLEAGPNRPRPGVRPVSSMTPTIAVRGGRAVIALGGSGGMTIATNVTQVLLSRLVFDQSPSEAVRSPRLSIPLGDGSITVPKGTPAKVIADLEWRGEIVKAERFGGHAVQMITADGSGWSAAADPRKFGSALAR